MTRVLYNPVMKLSLDSSVQYVPRIGPAMAEKLKILGIETVQQLLYHIPFRYNDYSHTVPIRSIQAGETVTVKGTVASMKNLFSKGGKKVQQAVIADDTGSLSLTWFNQPFLVDSIVPGTILDASGTVNWFGNKLVLSSPEYEILQSPNQAGGLHTGRLVPVYSLTEGISEKWMRGRIAYLLTEVDGLVTEFLPEELRTHHKLVDLIEALKQIHFPETMDQAVRAKRRLAFDELFLLQLTARMMRHTWETTHTAPHIAVTEATLKAFTSLLPFTLTADQQKTITDITTDFQKPYPMNRLLEGDVGSGKTVVAAAAIYGAWEAGYQSILMAPTQILAEQHLKTLTSILSSTGMNISLITGATKGDRAQGSGSSKNDVLVGTHALLNESVQPDKLGLIVIDEQHRFGVKQRQLLREKSNGATPHLLTMTATPIPRTIALTMYGNLDLSTIQTPPAGRQRVKTWVVPSAKRKGAYLWIAKQLKEHNAQAFIVCPLIEVSESETMASVKAVTQEFTSLQKIFKDFRLALLHGRMKPTEKTDALDAMNTHRIDILVTTPVVEVGIDIPNATIMMIEGAERFGLAQLHQLRGRVGRGEKASYCLLFPTSDQGEMITRLKALETTYSGPALAELDLRLRGPGEVLGTRQHGLPELKIANFQDTDLIEETQKEAQSLVENDPTLTGFPLLREALKSDTIQQDVSQD